MEDQLHKAFIMVTGTVTVRSTCVCSETVMEAVLMLCVPCIE